MDALSCFNEAVLSLVMFGLKHEVNPPCQIHLAKLCKELKFSLMIFCSLII